MRTALLDAPIQKRLLLLPWVALAIATGSSQTEAVEIEVGVNFTASTMRDASAGFPPDTMMAVGEEHIVELINWRYSVFRKSDGSLVEFRTLDNFWNAAGVSPAASAFDPRILYDAQTQRWFAISVDDSYAANNILLAVSGSSDPTGTWTGFQIASDPAGTRWADYPLLGTNGAGVFVSANMRSNHNGAYESVTVLVVPKADLVAFVPTLANHSLFANIPIGTVGITAQPVVDLDQSTNLEILLADFSIFALLVRSEIVGDVSEPQLEGPVTIESDPFDFPPPAPQPGPKSDLETVGDQLGNPFQSNLVLLDGSIWGVHTVPVGGRSSLHWFELDAATDQILQSRLIADNGLSFYYGSIAVNEFGHVVIGFSGSSESQFVSSYAVVGETIAGTTRFGAPLLLKQGTSDYEPYPYSTNRWGDYSATVVDPTDPLTFRTIQEFVYGTDVWGTQVTQLILTPEPLSSSLALVSLLAMAALTHRRRPFPKGPYARLSRGVGPLARTIPETPSFPIKGVWGKGGRYS